MATPIKLTIYNDEHEPVKELQTSLIPWGLLKRAIKLAKTLKADGMSQEEILQALDEEGFENLTALVADLFHGKVTIEELTWGTDATEMLTILVTVVTRAFSEFGQNPTKPGE